MRWRRYGLVGVFLCAGALGCGASIPAPFDGLQSGNVTVLRLQNYEQPAQAAAAQAPLPGIPPEIQAWAQQAAPVLQQLLPPGLVPPEMLQGQVLAPQQQAQQFRFHGRLVLGTQQVLDPELKEQLAELFGDPDNFQAQHQPCNYSELGMGWNTTPGAPPHELLISFSCNRIEPAPGFTWPHGTGLGMKPKMVHGLARVIGKLFPRTSAPMPAPVSSLPRRNSLALR